MSTSKNILDSIGTVVSPLMTNVLLTDMKNLPPQFSTNTAVIAFTNIVETDRYFGGVLRNYEYVIAIVFPRNGDIFFQETAHGKMEEIRNALFPLDDSGNLRVPLLPSQPNVYNVEFGEVVGQDWSKYVTNHTIIDLGVIVSISEER